MIKRKIKTIAAHEYITNVRRREFILITLGLPFFMLIIGGIGILSAGTASGSFHDRAKQVVAIVDPAHVIDLPAAEKVGGLMLKSYGNAAIAQDDIRTRKLDAAIILDNDYVTTGEAKVYKLHRGLMDVSDRIPVGELLRRGLLARVTDVPALVTRLNDPLGGRDTQVYVLDKTGQFRVLNLARETARFVVPYIFISLMTFSIFIASNYLLRSIADEKENRVIEVIISSVSAEELLLGKLIGLSGVALTQVGVWLAFSAIPAMLTLGAVVQITGAALIEAVVFFILGFWLYATMMAGLGALGTSYRESQQIGGSVSMLAVIPLLVIPVLLEYPNGVLARILSYIPFTAPTTMVLRVTATDVPTVDLFASVLSIVFTSWLMLKLSARLFRFGLLVFGKRPTLRETLRLLRHA